MAGKSRQEEAVSWQLMTWIVLASLFGVGVLSIPAGYLQQYDIGAVENCRYWSFILHAAFQRLGWIPAIVSTLGAAAVAIYSGTLYTRLLVELPWATTFHELGERALGRRRGFTLVSCTAYLAIFLVPIVLHLACAQALQNLFGGDTPNLLMAGFCVAIIIMPLSQLRDLGQVGWLGAASSGIMAAAMLLLALKLWKIDPPEHKPHTALVERQPFMVGMVGVLNIFFVFSGQENWVRYLESMGRQRKHFSRSTSSALGCMTPLVALVGGVGYAFRGGSLDLSDPVTSGLKQDAWARLINAGVLLALLVAYVVHINVASQVLLEMVAPSQFKPHEARGRKTGTRAAAHLDNEPSPAPAAVDTEALQAPLLTEVEQGTEALQMKVAIDDNDAMATHVTLTPASDEAQEGSSRAAEHNHSHFLNDLATKRVLWGLTSVSFVLLAWLIGYLWPRFSELEGVVSALGGVSAQMLLPCLFAIRVLKLSRAEKIVCIVLCVLSVSLTSVGLYASISQLVS